MLHPSRIYGAWDEGVVLDNHMLKSVFLGYDENGKEQFENTRTELGELLYRFKYQGDKAILDKIMELITEILDKWKLKDKIDLVIPVPPTNRKRKYQPVVELSLEIAKFLNKECNTNLLVKNSDSQSKDGMDIAGTINQIGKIDKDLNVLVIDDLYSTGATLNETCKVLKANNNIKKIYCLTMTKTKG